MREVVWYFSQEEPYIRRHLFEPMLQAQRQPMANALYLEHIGGHLLNSTPDTVLHSAHITGSVRRKTYQMLK